MLSDTLISHSGRLITGGAGRNLRLWSVVGVAEMKLPGDNNNMRRDGLTMEDEMNLDGMIVSASFDEPLEMVRQMDGWMYLFSQDNKTYNNNNKNIYKAP